MDVTYPEGGTILVEEAKPESLEDRNKRLTTKLQKAFNSLYESEKNDILFDDFVQDRAVTDTSCLLDLFKNGCQTYILW